MIRTMKPETNVINIEGRRERISKLSCNLFNAEFILLAHEMVKVRIQNAFLYVHKKKQNFHIHSNGKSKSGTFLKCKSNH